MRRESNQRNETKSFRIRCRQIAILIVFAMIVQPVAVHSFHTVYAADNDGAEVVFDMPALEETAEETVSVLEEEALSETLPEAECIIPETTSSETVTEEEISAEDAALPVKIPDTEPISELSEETDDANEETSDRESISIIETVSAEEEPADPEKETDKADFEKSLPAQDFKGQANGLTVTVSAMEGAFPEGTEMIVVPAPTETIEEAFDNIEKVKAVDITFKDKDGHEIEPEKLIEVTLHSEEISSDAAVVHVDEYDHVDTVDASVKDGEAIFQSDSFSIYAIVETGDDARLLVRFAGWNGELIDSIYVKKSDDIKQVLCDPGAGVLADSVYFRGWTRTQNYDSSTAQLDIEGVRSEVAGMLPPSADGAEVTYYAMLFSDYRITYMDENGISLGQDEITFRADSPEKEQPYTVNMGYTVQDDTHHFEGWHVVSGDSNIVGHTENRIYQNNDGITIKGDVAFGVEAPEGHWFIFDENGKGAAYKAPQFVQSGSTPERPDDADMIRNGYTFGGWFADKAIADQTSGGTPYDFDQTLTNRMTVYARWIPRTDAGYTIIIWKQNIAGDGYDFEEAVSLTGNVGSMIDTVRRQGTGDASYAQIRQNGQWKNRQYTGFHLKEFDQNVTVKTEGGSVVNIYFDRSEYTLQFQIPGENNRWSTIKTIKALYQQPIGDNFPIEGDNGVVYNNGDRWDPQNSSTYNQVLVYIDIMPAESVTFRLNTATHTTKHIYYYVETLPGETPDTSYNGRDFVLHKSIAANYRYFTEAEDYFELAGFDKFGYLPNNAWGSGGAGTVYCYYTRSKYDINFMDGIYVDGDSNLMTEAGQGQIGTGRKILYGADVSEYNTYKPDAAYTPSGYVFEGWYLDSACTQPYTFRTMPEGGITVYAKWRQKQYRVFLHVNYPEGATGDINWGTANQEMSFRISEGGHISEPTGRDLTGYEFVGWYLDEACAQVFNGEVYTINEKSVTVPYDMTVDMTDTYDNNGKLIDPKSNSDLIGWDDDNDPDTPGKKRFWITTKLDIYAKWRATMEGASGIVIQYDANGGTGAPTDSNTYVDGAKAPAGAASKAPEGSNKVFSHWTVQKWNGKGYEDTETEVYPGGTFSVLAEYARVEEVTPSGSAATKKYTVCLKAVYVDSETPAPTHIHWYKNDGSDAYIKEDNAEINAGVAIPAAPVREGYEFLGWSRIAIGVTQKDASAWETDRANWTQNLTEKDLYLYYEKDGTYHLDSPAGMAVTQVAADEKMPYRAMFAVWKTIVTPSPTITPAPTVTPTITPVPTVTPTVTPAPTVAPTVTPVPTVAPTVTSASTAAPTITPAPVVRPTVTPVPAATLAPLRPAGSSAISAPAVRPVPVPTSEPMPTETPASAKTHASAETPASAITHASAETPVPTMADTPFEAPEAEEPERPEKLKDEPGEGQGEKAWALLNLLIVIGTVILSIAALLLCFKKKEDDGNDGRRKGNGGLIRVLSAIPAAASVATFILTEDVGTKMQMTDIWTILMAVCLIINAIIVISAAGKDGFIADFQDEEL